MDDESKVLLQSIAKDVSTLTGDVAILKEKVTSLDGRMTSVEGTLTKTLAKVVDIDERLKTDYVTKEEAKETESRIVGHIDGLVKGYKDTDQEQVMLRSAYDRHEERIVKLEKQGAVV